MSSIAPLIKFQEGDTIKILLKNIKNGFFIKHGFIIKTRNVVGRYNGRILVSIYHNKNMIHFLLYAHEIDKSKVILIEKKII